jgi:hypothetical protein
MSAPQHESGFAYHLATLPPPLQTVPAILLHARLHALRVAKPAILWPYGLLLLLAGGGGWAIAHESLEAGTAMTNYLQQFVLRAGALVGLGLGVAAIRQDAEAGALPSFMLRPRAEIALPVGRFLAVAGWSALLGTMAVVLTLLGSWGTLLQPSPSYITLILLAAPLHAIAWAGICVGLGAWIKQAAAAGLAWLVIGDAVLGQFSEAGGILSPSLHVSRILTEDVAKADPMGGATGLLILAALGCIAAVVRLQRDVPTTQAD